MTGHIRFPYTEPASQPSETAESISRNGSPDTRTSRRNAGTTPAIAKVAVRRILASTPPHKLPEQVGKPVTEPIQKR